MLRPHEAEPAGDRQVTAGHDAISMILAQAGRSPEEIASLATLDEADRAAEGQFSGEPPTLATLFGQARVSEFDAGRFSPTPEVAATMAACLEFLLERKRAGTLLDHERMLFADATIAGLAERGFFGLAIPKRYAGSGAKLGDLGPLLRALTLIHPDLAVMFEVHNFLGPVTPLLDFGTDAQKDHYLPMMARGELLGSFALTEPGVGADPSRLSLTARRDGDRWLVSGVKWPITNVIYGGICVLVLKLDGEGLPKGRDSAMLIFEVPKADDAHFRMIRNRLSAFDYLWNARFRLTDCPVPAGNLLGPPGKGLAQAFSSLAKGRGGICVNSAAKIFRLLAQLIQDPEVEKRSAAGKQPGGWVHFRNTFGRPIGESPRISAWFGRATAHALASRVLGDVCFRLAANGVRDETMGMIAKVFSTKALLDTAIHAYQVQGGRSVHVDERRAAARRREDMAAGAGMIENYIGENMHEFVIATVYEGPNPVLADVGAANAMTRGIRTRFLEPIGLAEAKGKFGWAAKAAFGWYVVRTVIGSFNPAAGSFTGMERLGPARRRLVHRALRRNRVLGRRILLLITRYQKSFIEESFLLGDEGGIFDQLCASTAALVYAIANDRTEREYALVAEALDLEAELLMRRRSPSAELQRRWAEIGRLVMTGDTALYKDLIADIEVSRIPLDPRSIDLYI
ncbi:MAG: acyl-CoA/acyl-ACP dehydrogenase [Planctomycetia bacterium]|nr:acyl-CoA/acyl-ACP dehydrogenase [Planctomycetia bacterium]